MPSNYFPSKDSEYVIWLDNFVKIANANLAILGLTTVDIKNISDMQPIFITNLNDVEAKKDALSSAIYTKDATKDKIIFLQRSVVKRIQANSAVTPALKAQLGISTGEGGQYPLTPVPPTDLIAKLLPDGAVELKWNRNNNAPNTLFAIEILTDAIPTWTLLDVVTKTNYIHKTHVLGTAIKYIIKARRGSETSAGSNIASI